MGLLHWRKGFEDISTITMIQEKDLGRGIPKSTTVITPEPVVEETKPLTKLEQYKLRLEEKEKAKIGDAAKILSQIIQHKDEQEIIAGVINYLKQERGTNGKS